MAHFVLLHGGAHGSWCWELVIPELTARGHSVIAPDLPLHDPAVGVEDCVELVQAAIATTADEVVLVGHSASGTVVPSAASAIRARLMVFLCAAVPLEGSSWLDQMAAGSGATSEGAVDGVTIDEFGRATFSPGAAREIFFHDCDAAITRRAIDRLVPFASTLSTATFPVDAWPQIPAVSIVGSLDRAILPAWSRRVCKDRLGTDPIELATGHSPFFAQPAALACALESVTESPS